MEYRDKVFDGGVVALDGNTFTGCTFRDCMLVFEASAPPNLGANQFDQNIALALKGQAGATMQLLAMLYERGGKSGREIVEEIFEQIRDGTFYDSSGNPRSAG